MPKCRICKSPFKRVRQIQPTCGEYKCAVAFVEARVKSEIEKASKKKARERKESLKSRSAWMKEAQAAVNAYVRFRDSELPCISCGRHHNGQYHAGHYRSIGACPELRFDEQNIHKQCAPCNTYLSGNLIKYRSGLISKIGLEAVERIESAHPAKKYSVEDLKNIITTFKGKLNNLKLQVKDD